MCACACACVCLCVCNDFAVDEVQVFAQFLHMHPVGVWRVCLRVCGWVGVWVGECICAVAPRA